MRAAALVVVAIVVSSALLVAQEGKPVPKDSVRVSISGCTKGAIFTAGPRTREQPRSSEIPEGMHLRMNGPKKMLADIKVHEGSMIELTGLMKIGQYGPEGVGIGGGVRITPGPAEGGNRSGNLMVRQILIDVEGWRPVSGDCTAR